MALPWTPKRRLHKRDRGSPTGQTPVQDPKRVREKPPLRSFAAPLRSLVRPRKQLDFSSPESQPQLTQERSSWSDTELTALVEFVLFRGTADRWPGTKNRRFWESTATFVGQRSGRGLVC